MMTELSRPAAQTTSRSVPSILLAEDDENMRLMLAAALRADGYEVVEARDGGRLLVYLAQAYLSDRAHEAYDLLVTDIRMPICSGLQILESLRQAHWRTPAVLMTAFGDEQTSTRAEALGAIMFAKPFDVDDLRTAVLHILTHRGVQQ
jgi:DNA-binding response OmpR family regulator